MGYTPTEWQSGDIVTSEKLNKLENGVAGTVWERGVDGQGNPVPGAVRTGDYTSQGNTYSQTASGEGSTAEGNRTVASGDSSHAEGNGTTASQIGAHSEGISTVASGYASHAEGLNAQAQATGAHAEGFQTRATESFAHAEGNQTVASAGFSHAEGLGTIAASLQHAEGKYNVEDSQGQYLHIVGNGESAEARSNAHTLDWAGNAWFAGSVEASFLILTAGNGNRYKVIVDNEGVVRTILQEAQE